MYHDPPYVASKNISSTKIESVFSQTKAKTKTQIQATFSVHSKKYTKNHEEKERTKPT